ncbi:hypothetical protein SE17_02480 [Kouleothrix aurantiaca]|uniref:Uncharacterized protein n=1 Tax=Kouleothrix aurantiaca TaxID=186479 RepID=A0A0P9HIG9_9CHLR|nr:hypothetical protein SE17_02480 [Kouleothrix aurantiaca]
MTTSAQVQQQTKVRLTADLIGQMVWLLGASVVSILVGAFFWKLGADFTILALRWFARGLGIPQTGWGWYVAPFTFSVFELAAWKQRGKLPPRMLFAARGITAFDMGSTAFGVFLAIVTSYFVMLGIESPTQIIYGVAILIAGVAGWSITLFPERLVLDGILQIVQVAKAFYVAVKGGK